MAAKRQELKSRCARFFITCLRAENFFALKTRKAVTLNTRFICRRSVIPGSVFLCYVTIACYSSCRRRRHWAIESETYMVSSYCSALLKSTAHLCDIFELLELSGMQ